jgi:hypothetical protein
MRANDGENGDVLIEIHRPSSLEAVRQHNSYHGRREEG